MPCTVFVKQMHEKLHSRMSQWSEYGKGHGMADRKLAFLFFPFLRLKWMLNWNIAGKSRREVQNTTFYKKIDLQNEKKNRNRNN